MADKLPGLFVPVMLDFLDDDKLDGLTAADIGCWVIILTFVKRAKTNGILRKACIKRALYGRVKDSMRHVSRLHAAGMLVRRGEDFYVNNAKKYKISQLGSGESIGEIEIEIEREIEIEKTIVEPANDSGEILSVFNHYRGYHKQSNKNPTSKSKEWRAIKARLSEGYTVADLCLAIDGCHVSPWNCGENPNGKKYQSLELIMRNASKVDSFMEANLARAGPVMGEKERRGARAGQAWLERKAKNAGQ